MPFGYLLLPPFPFPLPELLDPLLAFGDLVLTPFGAFEALGALLALGAFEPPFPRVGLALGKEVGNKLIDGLLLGMLDTDGIVEGTPVPVGMALILGPREGSLEGAVLGIELTLGPELGPLDGLPDGSREMDGVDEGPDDGDKDGS